MYSSFYETFEYLFPTNTLGGGTIDIFGNSLTPQQWLCHTLSTASMVAVIIAVLAFMYFLFKLFGGLLSNLGR